MENLMVKMALKYGLARLREPSTWAALAAGLAGSMHMEFNGDFTKAFVSFGLAGAALLGIALKEGIKK